MMTRKHKLIAFFALCLLVFIGASVPHGQAALEIVAKVNGKAITNYDVDQRAAFLRMVTNLDDTKANCLLYTSPSPRDKRQSRMPSSA